MANKLAERFKVWLIRLWPFSVLLSGNLRRRVQSRARQDATRRDLKPRTWSGFCENRICFKIGTKNLGVFDDYLFIVG